MSTMLKLALLALVLLGLSGCRHPHRYLPHPHPHHGAPHVAAPVLP